MFPPLTIYYWDHEGTLTTYQQDVPNNRQAEAQKEAALRISREGLVMTDSSGSIYIPPHRILEIRWH